MPKKSTSARSGVQRTKPKAQKSFELVRPVSEVQEREAEETLSTDNSAVETGNTTPVNNESSSELIALPTVPKKKERSSSIATATAPVAPVAPKVAEIEPSTPTLKGNASTRLAARRNAQRGQQRSSASLITPEHYSYVRRDLAFIAVLAVIMFIAIIVLYFVPGIGV